MFFQNIRKGEKSEIVPATDLFNDCSASSDVYHLKDRSIMRQKILTPTFLLYFVQRNDLFLIKKNNQATKLLRSFGNLLAFVS
jgi:stress response protein YsnF